MIYRRSPANLTLPIVINSPEPLAADPDLMGAIENPRHDGLYDQGISEFDMSFLAEISRQSDMPSDWPGMLERSVNETGGEDGFEDRQGGEVVANDNFESIAIHSGESAAVIERSIVDPDFVHGDIDNDDHSGPLLSGLPLGPHIEFGASKPQGKEPGWFERVFRDRVKYSLRWTGDEGTP